MSAWKELIVRYADGKTPCNCGDAYLSNCGHGSVWVDGKYEKRTDLPVCAYGCDANIAAAKRYVAKRVAEELGIE